MEKFTAAWFDVDGTLVTGDNAPSAEIKKALAKTRFGVNTQRSIGQTEKIINPQEITTLLPSIILSGGEIWNLGKELVKAFPIPAETRLGIAQVAEKNKADIAIARFYPMGNRNIHFYVANDELEEKFASLYKSTNSFGKMTRDINEFYSWLRDTETSMVTLRTLQKTAINFPEELKSAIEIDPSSKTDYVITAKGIRKATSLLWLCEYLGIDPSKVLTAGDNPAVDSEVFKHTFGISIAPEILPHAKMNVKTIEELATLLDKIFTTND